MKLVAALAIFNVPAAFAQDPDFFLDFNTDPSDQLEIIAAGAGGDTAEWRSSGGVDDSGYLSLTDAVNDARAAVIFEDPTGGKPIEGLKFTIDCRIGGGTNDPADGFSLNIVRPDDPLLQEPRGSGYAGTTDIGAGETNLPEEGSQTGLGIGFDAWVSGGQDIIGFSVRVDGEMVEQVAAGTKNGESDDVTSLQTGPQSDDADDPYADLTWQPFEAELTAAGALTIKWKGQTIVDALQVDYFPGPGQVVFGARTGGANQAHHFDNLSLTILAATKAVVSGRSFGRDFVSFSLTDGEAGPIDPDTVGLEINGQMVTPVVTKDGLETTVRFEPEDLFEIAAILSYSLTAKDTAGNDIGRSGTLQLPDPIFPLDELAGAPIEEGFFGTRYIWGGVADTTIGSSEEAVRVIQAAANGTWDGQVFDTLSQTINFTTGGIFGQDDQYPVEVAEAEDWTGDNFVQYNRAYLRFAQPGDYTFGVHSDDGFGLRVLGGPEFTSVESGVDNENGTIDPVLATTLLHVAPTGDANTRGVLNVPVAGTYLVEFFWWEAAGGDNGELYVSQGAITGGDADPNADWRLVGDSESFLYDRPGVDSDGWTVVATAPREEELGTLAAAITALEGDTVSANADALNHSDPDANGGEAAVGGDDAVPGGVEGTDDDNFAIKGTAKLVIPRTGEYNIGFRSDDGAQLRIIGQDWKEIVSSALEDGVAVIEGDALIADVPTGNSQTIASIDLEEGTYDIEFIGFEIAGGANFEVVGNGSTGPLPGGAISRDGAALDLVSEPIISLVGPPAVRLPVVEFAREGDNVRIDFESIDPAAEHLLQSSADLQEWTDVETTLTVVDGNVLSAVGASLDPQTAYYRVRQVPPPAILEDDFEGDDQGWTIDNGVWEVGVPAGMLSSALSGENVYASSLMDGYPAGSNTGLRSPLLDLTEVERPRLRFFYNNITTEDEQGGVRLDFLDENGDPLFDSDIIFQENTNGWVEFNRPFPTEAQGQKVFVEFRLLTDGDDSNDGFGFALDDVLVK